MSLLRIENMSVAYGSKTIVSDINISVMEGQVVGILGPNGCGKTTLLKALCKGLPYQGTAVVAESDLQSMPEKALAKICSYVPQRSGLAIDISALDAVLMGFNPYLGILERPSKDMRERAQEILTRLGLGDFIYANFMELSEGQRRLCILARSLVTDSKLLIMDEPDASLDFDVRKQVMNVVAEKVSTTQGGALVTLHDMSLALDVCDCIYTMKDGKILDALKPKEDKRDELEEKLSHIYGDIQLVECIGHNGEKKLAVI